MLAETIVVLLSLKSRSYDRVPMIITYKHEYGGGGGGVGITKRYSRNARRFFITLLLVYISICIEEEKKKKKKKEQEEREEVEQEQEQEEQEQEEEDDYSSLNQERRYIYRFIKWRLHCLVRLVRWLVCTCVILKDRIQLAYQDN